MSLHRSYVSKNALTGPTGAYLPPHKLSTCWAIISWMLKHTQKPIISGCVLISHIPMSWLWTAIFSSTNMVLFVLMSRNSSAASFPHQPLNIFTIICLLNELLSESHSRRSRQQKGGNWSLSVHRVTLTLSLWTTASKLLWNLLWRRSLTMISILNTFNDLASWLQWPPGARLCSQLLFQTPHYLRPQLYWCYHLSLKDWHGPIAQQLHLPLLLQVPNIHPWHSCGPMACMQWMLLTDWWKNGWLHAHVTVSSAISSLRTCVRLWV